MKERFKMIIMYMLEKQKNVIRYKYTTGKDDDNYGIVLINLDTKEIEFEKKYSDICENCDCHAYSKAEKMLKSNNFEKQVTVAWY